MVQLKTRPSCHRCSCGQNNSFFLDINFNTALGSSLEKTRSCTIVKHELKFRSCRDRACWHIAEIETTCSKWGATLLITFLWMSHFGKWTSRSQYFSFILWIFQLREKQEMFSIHPEQFFTQKTVTKPFLVCHNLPWTAACCGYFHTNEQI